MALPPPPPPTNSAYLPVTPPPLRYFGSLAFSLPASLPSSLPLPPHLFPLHSTPSEHLSQPLPTAPALVLSLTLSLFSSLSSSSPSLVFLIFLSPSNPFPKFLPQAFSISLSPPLSPSPSPPFPLPFSPFCLPHLAPPPTSYLSALLFPFLPRPDSPSREELRDRGSGRRPPPLPAVGENGLAGKGRRGRGRWEHTGSVGPFKGSFMGWREAETKRLRRRDTARASLGGDKQTRQAGGNQAQKEMGSGRPQWTATQSPPPGPAQLLPGSALGPWCLHPGLGVGGGGLGAPAVPQAQPPPAAPHPAGEGDRPSPRGRGRDPVDPRGG